MLVRIYEDLYGFGHFWGCKKQSQSPAREGQMVAKAAGADTMILY